MVRVRILLTSLATAATLLVAAGAWAQTPLPRPSDDRSVYDLAGVLEPRHASAMQRLHGQLFARTEVAIVVVTVPELVGETIDELAVRIGHDWGVGGAEQDQGIVIALSESDRQIFVATGYGVEGYLPDGRVGSILDQHVIPHLRQNRFSDGLMAASAALATIAAQEHGVTLDLGGAGPQTTMQPQQEELGPVGIVLVILGIVVFVYMAIKHPRLLILLMIMSRGGAGRGF